MLTCILVITITLGLIALALGIRRGRAMPVEICGNVSYAKTSIWLSSKGVIRLWKNRMAELSERGVLLEIPRRYVKEHIGEDGLIINGGVRRRISFYNAYDYIAMAPFKPIRRHTLDVWNMGPEDQVSDAVVLEFAMQGHRDALLAAIARAGPSPFVIGDLLAPKVRERIETREYIDAVPRDPSFA